MLNNVKQYKRLPAFTVMELLVVMVLSGIVIGIMYLYFLQFQGYLRLATEQSAQYNELGFFNQVFQRDIEFADELYFKPGSVLQLKIGDESMEYRFKSQSIVRRWNRHSETFQIKTSNLQITKMKEYNKLVSDIEFEGLLENDMVMQFSFHKEYHSKTLFDQFNKKD